jgi:aminoglycoside phosphotransferase (APT) family kinase protein
VDADGRAFVLKRSRTSARAAAVTEALRSAGYPAPRYVRVEPDWSLQEELPGEPPPPWRPLPERVAARLIELSELQGATPLPPSCKLQLGSWRRVIAGSILSGARSYMSLATLRRHSDRSRELLDRCQAAARRFGESLRDGEEVVHWDFTPANVLVTGGEVTGVIDWEGVRAGDRLFDLVTLAFHAPGTLLLDAYLETRLEPGARSVYLAHLCIRQAEWSLRRQDAETGERMLAYALDVSSRFPA